MQNQDMVKIGTTTYRWDLIGALVESQESRERLDA